MPVRLCLLALLLAALPLTARAQSIYHDSRALPGQSTTSPPREATPAPAPGTAPKATTPPIPGIGPKANPGDPGKKSQPMRPLPPGSVVAPPGSIILPPATTVPPPGRGPDNRRVKAITLCNQRQIACNNACNSHTMGTMRGLCYRQCSSQYLSCVNRANTQP